MTSPWSATSIIRVSQPRWRCSVSAQHPQSTQHTQGPEVRLVWAEARGGVIGRDGGMPWHLPEDLAHFKRATLGHPVVMGRRTWESLPERFRPLPGRANIVVTRDANYVAEGAIVVTTFDAAMTEAEAQLGEHAGSTGVIAVIGGGEIFRLAMPVATDLIVTKIALDVAGADASAPELDSAWELRESGDWQTSASGLEYRIEHYVRGAR